MNYYQVNLSKKTFWGTVGINDFSSEPGFIEIQNLPGSLVLSFVKNTPEKFNLSIFNIAGQKIYSESDKLLNPGNSIRVQPGAAGVYLVRIETPQTIQSFKVIGKTGESTNKIEFLDGTQNIQITKSASIVMESKFDYNIGDSIRLSVFKDGYYSFPEKLQAINPSQVNFQLKSSMALVSGISDAYFPLEEISTYIESFNQGSGIVELKYSGQIPNIREGNIITVDLDTIGYLRKVTKVTEIGGKLTVETKQASLNELFVEKKIRIDTELITPDNILKSSSNAKISEALTDKDGYIHPVEIIYQLGDGSKMITSAFTKNSQAGDVFELFRFDENFKMDLVGTKDEDLHFHIEEGNVSLVGNAKFDFDFKYSDNLAPDTKVKQGDLEIFSYFIKLKYNSAINLALDMKLNDKKSGVRKVWDMKKITAKFLIGAVPLWITFDLDFYASYLMDAEVSADAHWGYTNTINATVGGTYQLENDSFIPLTKPYNDNLVILPLTVTDKFTVKTRFELYPRIDAMFYGFMGPYVELIPNLTVSVDAKMQTQLTPTGQENFIAWNSSIDAGIDLRTGLSLTFLDAKIKEFTPLHVNLFHKRLWEAPDSMSLESEIPGVSKVGDKIRLNYQVFDNLKNPLAGCPVVFKDDEGFSKIVFTGLTGIANLEYTVPEDTKKDNKVIITATLYNSEKSTIQKLVNEINLVSLKQQLIENSPWRTAHEEGKDIFVINFYENSLKVYEYAGEDFEDNPYLEQEVSGTWKILTENSMVWKLNDELLVEIGEIEGEDAETAILTNVKIEQKILTFIQDFGGEDTYYFQFFSFK